MTSPDVIVIGGGHNGLTAAALLADSGRKVVLLERRAVLGGLAVGDEFHPGFTSAGPLHDTSGFRRHLVERLELGRAGLQLTAEPSAIFAPQRPENGPGLLLHYDAARAAGEIAVHSSSDADRYAEFRTFLGRVRPIVARLLDAEPPAFEADVANVWSLAMQGLALRRLGRATMMELLRIGPMSVADWMDEWFETELLACTLAAPALFSTGAGPRSPGTAANLLRIEALAYGAVQGGPGALVNALETAARRRGVDIRLEHEVRRIVVENGAVKGVELATGNRIDAPVVAASTDPKHTILTLVPASSVTPTLHHQIDTFRARGSTALVNLAIRGSLRFSCRPDLDVARARVGETIDGLERAADAVKYGRSSETPILDVYVPTADDPSFAPSGHSVVSVVAHFAPYDLDAGWTDEVLERLGVSVVQTLGRHSPELVDQILAREVLGPTDIERRYGVSSGHVHHGEHALDQLLVRPGPLCARYTTPIRGLYLCGSGSHPGGGLTGGPGALGAAAVLRRQPGPSS